MVVGYFSGSSLDIFLWENDWKNQFCFEKRLLRHLSLKSDYNHHFLFKKIEKNDWNHQFEFQINKNFVINSDWRLHKDGDSYLGMLFTLLLNKTKT